MLEGMDPYDDTTFNGIRMRRFIVEWAEISAKASNSGTTQSCL